MRINTVFRLLPVAVLAVTACACTPEDHGVANNGRFNLTFTFNGQTRSTEGNQLMVARKEGGEWKIVALIWNDPPA